MLSRVSHTRAVLPEPITVGRPWEAVVFVVVVVGICMYVNSPFFPSDFATARCIPVTLGITRWGRVGGI